ncbi:MAG: hypothetical protein E6176_11190, partial [Clostridium celatum]|nr:hypothetical protein [Clostridium celatum]
MKRKILVFMLGIFIFVSSGCGVNNSTKDIVFKDTERDNENISIENNGSLDSSILNESTYNTNESNENKEKETVKVESAIGYVLKVDENKIYVDTENTEGRIYPGEGNDRAIIYDISNAEVDSPRGIRVGITVSMEYSKENGVNMVTYISSDGDEKEPIPIKEIAFDWLDDERKESIVNMDEA